MKAAGAALASAGERPQEKTVRLHLGLGLPASSIVRKYISVLMPPCVAFCVAALAN